uniref:Uncharacterized protein n=1 Tax=Glossina palpalis gambiensis TaxID=67801 RepID=A0A1B0AWA9_9MUSC
MQQYFNDESYLWCLSRSPLKGFYNSFYRTKHVLTTISLRILKAQFKIAFDGLLILKPHFRMPRITVPITVKFDVNVNCPKLGLATSKPFTSQ